MGSVKVDLHGKELLYKDMSLSDIDVIQLLIEYRYKYDKYAGYETDNMFDSAGLVSDLNQEIIATYATIDCLIKQCNFSNDQLKIIKMMEQGYDLKEIATELGVEHGKGIRKRFNKILRDIVHMNLQNWRRVNYIEKLELKTKVCRKCKESLPATTEFFRDHHGVKDGFQSRCRNCEK